VRPTSTSRRASLLLAALALSVHGCGAVRWLGGYTTASPGALPAALRSAHAPAEVGAARFMYDDFGSLNTDAMRTNAVPWKLVAAVLTLDASEHTGRPVSGTLLDSTLAAFGLLRPDSILNLPQGPAAVALDHPLGVVNGTMHRALPRVRLEVANLGCAACHAGVTYDRDGFARRDVWLGLPNTSVDLEAYVNAVYRSSRRWIGERRRVLGAVDTLFPGSDKGERHTLEHQVMPRAAKRIAKLEQQGDRPLPFHNGGPGFTNGAAALKMQLHVLGDDSIENELGYVSIPDLGGRLARTSLLADGTYSIPGEPRFAPAATGTDERLPGLARIVSFFTVPTMGLAPSLSRKAAPQVEDVLRFFAAYEPPRFPGTIDTVLAAEGEALYRRRCAGCHGSVEVRDGRARLTMFPNRLVPQDSIGSDPARWQAVSDALVGAIRSSGEASFIDAARTGGYVAPPLSGVWATAPYLHNGSVPTLWQLLRPDERPERFYVGGHRLDFERVGIRGTLDSTGTWRYPEGYRPWSTPILVDTRRRGLGHGGHERQFAALSDEQCRELIEFLKRF
jgi:mono/diheme cytochrome c family protein